jgi:hypothetical protein
MGSQGGEPKPVVDGTVKVQYQTQQQSADFFAFFPVFCVVLYLGMNNT